MLQKVYFFRLGWSPIRVGIFFDPFKPISYNNMINAFTILRTKICIDGTLIQLMNLINVTHFSGAKIISYLNQVHKYKKAYGKHIIMYQTHPLLAWPFIQTIIHNKDH